MKSVGIFASCAAVGTFSRTASAGGGGGPWDRVGPWNIFDDKDLKGEAGTLACAASPKANPDLIYAGGQNNGVSSGIIKTTDGGVHWTRHSNGLWDTAVLGVWCHPADLTCNHVLAGTHSGIYESTDGAASWTFRAETAGWGNVMSFREGKIGGVAFALANSQNGILTQPLDGSANWTRIATPGGLAPNAHLSIVANDAGGGGTEVVTCVGGWGGGELYTATLDSPSSATWTGPIHTQNETYTAWSFFPGTSEIYAKCKTPTSCDPGIHVLGQFADLQGCQAAVNATTAFKVASYTYQHNVTSLGGFAAYCYGADATVPFSPTTQPDVDSGRAPGVFPGAAIDCANAAVDPNDREHILYSTGGQYRLWETTDGGRTTHQVVSNTEGVYFVMVDEQGWQYTATQAGAFVSTDKGGHWDPLHVYMTSRAGKVIDRVPHDYQRIVPNFRGDGIAFPSDQGLHILNRSAVGPGRNFWLTSAVGDMKNTMSLSALISPSVTTAGSRNLIVNLWDWDVGASFDDGATWAGWKDTEASPGSCGEGGGGSCMGTSGACLMYHHNNWYSSLDGGHNFIQGDLPGSGGSFDYFRKAGSRAEPSGAVFAVLNAPAVLPTPPPTPPPTPKLPSNWVAHPKENYRCAGSEFKGDLGTQPSAAACLAAVKALSGGGVDFAIWNAKAPTCYICAVASPGDIKFASDPDAFSFVNTLGSFGDAKAKKAKKAPYKFTYGVRDNDGDGDGNLNYLMVSSDMGQNWTYSAPFPADWQCSYLVADPTSETLYGMTADCVKKSGDKGKTWSACLAGAGLTGGSFKKLLVKDAKTMFMLRNGKVPLRTADGGATWTELTAAAPLFQYGASFDGSLSWSGKTLVLLGFDGSAIGRGARGTSVWKTSNDGDDWTDETGDVVTNSPGPGVWYENDFYFVTRGEGVMVKRAFEQKN
jgi:hypothetical protein